MGGVCTLNWVACVLSFPESLALSFCYLSTVNKSAKKQPDLINIYYYHM